VHSILYKVLNKTKKGEDILSYLEGIFHILNHFSIRHDVLGQERRI